MSRLVRGTATDAPSEQQGDGQSFTLRGLLPTVLVSLLVAGSVIAAAAAGPWRIRLRDAAPLELEIDRPESTPSPRPESLTEGMPPAGGLPAWLGWLGIAFAAFCLVLVVVLAVLAIRALLRSARARERAEADESEGDLVVEGEADEAGAPALREGVARATRALAAQAEPADAVIAAWVALEQAAEGSGVARDPAQTASELTVAVLDATRADPEATRALLGLYLTARYSQRAVTDQDVRRAQECLAVLADGLRALRDAPPVPPVPPAAEPGPEALP